MMQEKEEYNNILVGYINNTIIKQQNSHSLAFLPVTRKISILLSMLLGSPAGVPYIKPAMRLFDKIKILEYLSAGSTVFGFGVDSVWGWYQLFNEFILDLYSAKKISFNVKTIIPSLISFVCALASIWVSAYTTHLYGASWSEVILVPITSMGLCFFGFYQLLNLVQTATCAKKNELYSAAYEFIELIDKIPLLPLQLNATDFSTIAIGNEKDFCHLISSKLSDLNQRSISYKQKGLVELLSILLSGGNAIVNSYLSFLAADMLTSNILIKLLFTGLVVVPTFVCERFGARLILNDFWNTLQSTFFNKKDHFSFSLQTFPFLTTLLNLLALVISCFSSSSRIYIAIDSFPIPYVNYLLGALAVGSGTAFMQFVLNEIID